MKLHHLRPDSWLLDPAGVLAQVPEARRAPGLPSPRISLPRAVVLGGRSANDMRRREKALHATGVVTGGWEEVGPGFRDTIAEFIRLHTDLKQMQGQTATFRYGTAARDFPPWLEGEVTAGRARVFGLRRDGNLLAAAVVLCANGESHSYRVAWATGENQFGLGILGTTREMEACAAAGDHLFDMGPGTEPYKAKWHPDVTTLVDVTATQQNWRTTTALRWLRLRGRPSPW